MLIHEFTHNGVADNVAAGMLDVGITSLPLALPGLEVEILGVDELVLIVNPHHRLAQHRKVRMVELHRQEMVLHTRRYATRQLLDNLFARAGAEPIVRIESVSTSLMLDIVRRTQLSAIVTRAALTQNQDLVVLPLANPSPERTMGLIWPCDKPRSPELDTFAAIVRSVVKELVRTKQGFRLS